MRVVECLAHTRKRLATHNVHDAGIEAEVLLRHTLSMDRSIFYASLKDSLSLVQTGLVEDLVRRRVAGEPLAYLLGYREFYGLDFVVDRHVMVPRQETELLVEKVLEYADSRSEESLLVADVGTGCGAIAVAIARNQSGVTVHAIDSSREALRVADVNRHRHGVSAAVRLHHGDLLDPLPEPVDVIVSNPPYLRTSDIPSLSREVRREPVRALDGGKDGLEVIRRLLRQAPDHLRPNGHVLFEIAPEQLTPVMGLGREAFPGAKMYFSRDLSGLPRAVSILTE